jgi:hypothetical protein
VFDGTINSFTDNKGNGNATLLSTQLDVGSATLRMGYWENIIGGAGHIVTLNNSASSFLTVFAMNVPGMATSASTDGVTRVADATSPYTSGTILTTNADDFLVGFIGHGESGTWDYVPGNSFTQVQEETDGNSFMTGNLAYRIVSATNNYESSFTVGTSLNGGVWVAAFKAAAGGGQTISATAGSLSLSGIAAIFRVGATMFLRYRK